MTAKGLERSGNMPEHESAPYLVRRAGEGFEVVDAAGAVVLVCQAETNATHYATLLGEAYRRGYRAGYRQAKTP